MDTDTNALPTPVNVIPSQGTPQPPAPDETDEAARWDCAAVVSAEEYDRILDMLDNPPPPTEAAIAAARRFMKRNG